MGIEERIPAMETEMVEFLQKLIRIPSIRSEDRRPGAPFGQALAEALQEVLGWGEAEGFKIRNVNGYAGHIEYGHTEETVGVLGHLDVVPAGDDWSSPPFAGEIREGRIVGRGTIDDKGPTVAAMFALKALKDAGLPLKRRVRLIVGCDEESNWECMEAYFKAEPKPTMGFTPDADFPLIFCEKGQLSVTLATDLSRNGSVSGVEIKAIEGGTRRNIVPDKAWAVLSVSDPGLNESVQAELKKIAAVDSRVAIEILSPQEIRVQAGGTAAHGSMPDLGDNALTRLVMMLNSLEGDGGAWPLVRFLARTIGREWTGSGLGIASNDPVSGTLTLNLGVINMDGKSVQAQLDIRYPVTEKGDLIADKIGTEAGKAGLTLVFQRIIPPHYVEQNHPLVRQLLKAYRDETGDTSLPLAVGGRTYATTMGTAVAFGPLFPGQPEIAHQRDEAISIEDLVKCARIYARALEALACG